MFILTLFCLTIATSPKINFKPLSMSITFFNVGQADSQLIELSNENLKYRIMIDFGRNTELPISNKTFDLCIVTHSHSDHYSYSCDIYDDFVCQTTLVSQNNIECLGNNIIPTIGQTLIDYSGYEISIKSVKSSCSDPNDCSIGIYFNMFGFKYFTAGDLKASEENELDFNGELIDLLKVSHHGSTTSSKQEYIERIKPSICIISSELIQDDCIPKLETIETLNKECLIMMTGNLDANDKCAEYDSINKLNIHGHGNINVKYDIGKQYFEISSDRTYMKQYLH
jgi:competence protein ComEC